MKTVRTSRYTYDDNGKVLEICETVITYPDEAKSEETVAAEQPQYREVKRPAKVGEWVKATVDCRGYCKVGDVLQVVSAPDRCLELPGKAYFRCADGAYLNRHEYVVLENYPGDTNG